MDSNLWGKKENAAPTAQGSLDGWGQKANPATIQAGADVATASPAADHGAQETYVSKDQYWKNKEDRDLEKERIYREEDVPAMRRSTAYNVAATLAAAALAGDAISFGSAAKGKRLDMYLGFVDLIADHVNAKLNGETPGTPAESADAEQPEVSDEQLG